MLPGAVLFDFDGILVDTEWAIYQAWLETFRHHGEELPLSLYTGCIGSDFDAWSPKVHLEDLTKLQFDWVKMDDDRQVVIRAALEEEGPIPGVIDLLEELQARDVPLAVVSSSSHSWVDGWLEKLNLASFFDQVVCKGDAPKIKPAPDLLPYRIGEARNRAIPLSGIRGFPERAACWKRSGYARVGRPEPCDRRPGFLAG